MSSYKENKALSAVISKSYIRDLVLKCALVFTGGIILTATVLYFSIYQPLGPSYQESFRMLSQLKQEILFKSIAIYAAVLVMIVLGIIFITLMYSHRVVGPMYRLSMFVKRITAGKIDKTATLRDKDVVQPLADELNILIINYRRIIGALNDKTEELKTLSSHLAACGDDPEKMEKSFVDIGAKSKEIEKILNDNVKL